MTGDGGASFSYTMAVWQEMIHEKRKEWFDNMEQ